MCLCWVLIVHCAKSLQLFCENNEANEKYHWLKRASLKYSTLHCYYHLFIIIIVVIVIIIIIIIVIVIIIIHESRRL
jgi:hypothetical protein